MKTFGVIMAGGGGERFWPLSRRKTPKQLLNLTGKDIMVNEALHRLAPVCSKGQLYVVTSAVQSEAMRTAVKRFMPPENVFVEPVGRNTAACIGFAAIRLIRQHGDGILVVTPSDAYIGDEREFQRVLSAAKKEAESENTIVTVGIRPTFPATGYGYIRFQPSKREIKSVLQFVEKPDSELARSFLESGDYLWNSGMFVFRASYMMSLFERFLPDLFLQLQQIGEAIGTESEDRVTQEIYPQMRSVSVDYGIMEKAEKIEVIPGDFGWSDLGSWDALSAVHTPDHEGNILLGDAALIDVTGSVVYSEKKLVAAVGLRDLIVVETEDALLLCDKSRAQDIKKIVELLRSRGREELL